MSDAISILREQIRQLQQRHDAGALEDAQFDAARLPLERKLLDAVLAQGAPAPAGSATPAMRSTAAAPPVSPRLWAGLAAAVVVLGAGGYFLTGPQGQIGQAPTGFGAAGADAAGPAEGQASAPHALGREQVVAMVEKLAARMEKQPDNAEGWGVLGRSYMTLGREADAIAAYQRALKLRPDEATLLVDYADALGVKNGRTLDGEPTKLIERALKIEPDNLKGLALAGTAAFNRGDFATAVKQWGRLIEIGPPDSPLVEMARGGAAEARERGKLPAVVEAPNPVTAALAGPSISGTVRLAAALRAQAAPEDTVFIFARPAEGSRMPLAILRRQVKDLPLEFKLDDSLALSPAAKLSGAQRVIVGARISKSGQAGPQPGDLEGLSAPVAVGATGVSLEISTRLP
jgi:cytochrome c-type biogenesis protein CcmH